MDFKYDFLILTEESKLLLLWLFLILLDFYSSFLNCSFEHFLRYQRLTCLLYDSLDVISSLIESSNLQHSVRREASTDCTMPPTGGSITMVQATLPHTVVPTSHILQYNNKDDFLWNMINDIWQHLLPPCSSILLMKINFRHCDRLVDSSKL